MTSFFQEVLLETSLAEHLQHYSTFVQNTTPCTEYKHAEVDAHSQYLYCCHCYHKQQVQLSCKYYTQVFELLHMFLSMPSTTCCERGQFSEKQNATTGLNLADVVSFLNHIFRLACTTIPVYSPPVLCYVHVCKACQSLMRLLIVVPTSGHPRSGVGIVTLLKHFPPPLGHSFGANPHTNRWGTPT